MPPVVTLHGGDEDEEERGEGDEEEDRPARRAAGR